MELNPRKRAILEAIINSYVEKGEPVGSKALCDMLDFSLSSATLRNEMSDLCALGYLEQPHTSAGRIPTTQGYKLYIDDLMNRDAVSGETKLIIDSLLEGLSGDVQDITHQAGQILSDLMGLPALTLTQSDSANTVKRIEAVPMGPRSVLLVLMTSNGLVKSRMLRGDLPPTADFFERFGEVCRLYIIGKPLSQLNRSYSQQIIARSGDFSMLGPIAALFDMIEDADRSTFALRGESNLFRCYKQEGQAHRLMSLLSQKELMLSLCTRLTEPIGVLFGTDTDISELKSATIVLARFGDGKRELGRIGVIGPTRMSYERVIPSLEYFAEKLSKVICDSLCWE